MFTRNDEALKSYDQDKVRKGAGLAIISYLCVFWDGWTGMGAPEYVIAMYRGGMQFTDFGVGILLISSVVSFLLSYLVILAGAHVPYIVVDPELKGFWRRAWAWVKSLKDNIMVSMLAMMSAGVTGVAAWFKMYNNTRDASLVMYELQNQVMYDKWYETSMFDFFDQHIWNGEQLGMWSLWIIFSFSLQMVGIWAARKLYQNSDNWFGWDMFLAFGRLFELFNYGVKSIVYIFRIILFGIWFVLYAVAARVVFSVGKLSDRDYLTTTREERKKDLPAFKKQLNMSNLERMERLNQKVIKLLLGKQEATDAELVDNAAGVDSDFAGSTWPGGSDSGSDNDDLDFLAGGGKSDDAVDTGFPQLGDDDQTTDLSDSSLPDFDFDTTGGDSAFSSLDDTATTTDGSASIEDGSFPGIDGVSGAGSDNLLDSLELPGEPLSKDFDGLSDLLPDVDPVEPVGIEALPIKDERAVVDGVPQLMTTLPGETVLEPGNNNGAMTGKKASDYL